ncbi:MAG: hypothetical protein Q9201_007236 [Fulgogasparrea decipioides]
MAKGRILITGASGFVGFRTLVLALEAGYSVVAVLPREDKSDLIRSAPSIKQMNPGSRLTFVTIPNIAAKDAFDEAVKNNIQYIMHSASPSIDSTILIDQFESQIIHPVVKGTQNVLSAALKSSDVQRIVITSSEAALIPYLELYELESFNTFTDNSPIPTADAPFATALAALSAARSRALAATDRFLAKNKPQFTVVNLMPSVILGRNELATTTKDFLESSNFEGLGYLSGQMISAKVPSTTVHINDVAKLHVLSLDAKKVTKTQNFMLSSGGIQGSAWYEAEDIVKKYYTEAVKKGWLAVNGEQPVNRVKIDAKRTGTVFGIEFTGFEKQVRDALDQWVELKAKEEKK